MMDRDYARHMSDLYYIVQYARPDTEKGYVHTVLQPYSDHPRRFKNFGKAMDFIVERRTLEGIYGTMSLECENTEIRWFVYAVNGGYVRRIAEVAPFAAGSDDWKQVDGIVTQAHWSA